MKHCCIERMILEVTPRCAGVILSKKSESNTFSPMLVISQLFGSATCIAFPCDRATVCSQKPLIMFLSQGWYALSIDRSIHSIYPSVTVQTHKSYKSPIHPLAIFFLLLTDESISPVSSVCTLCHHSETKTSILCPACAPSPTVTSRCR